MQEATRGRPDAGLAPVPALIGSWRWWRAIKTGKLETVVVEGTITKVLWTGMGDYPEFSMVDANGETKRRRRATDQPATGTRRLIESAGAVPSSASTNWI